MRDEVADISESHHFLLDFQRQEIMTQMLSTVLINSLKLHKVNKLTGPENQTNQISTVT